MPQPLPETITSLRDFYAFEQHVATARANRGLPMIAEWYEIPVFYFSNHQAIYHHEDIVPQPAYTQQLDYELEIAFVIGKAGINIPAAEAMDYIAGYTIMNDWSARDVQRHEMRVGLGPAKGKDFGTSLGPQLITPAEIEDRRIGTGAETRYDLAMVARINGQELSRGNTKDITFTFAQMIERASADVMLLPGDVFGSGTVGSGCLLELGGEQSALGRWLQPGDVVELEIERLGVLRNTVGKPRSI
ncbi:MAG: fumarylacetoacetate hydrolase family protein [Chloroflexi bacterium]|nr:fumarylacetoacetate hydrolase family protein [Chloroflexota bacterium]